MDASTAGRHGLQEPLLLLPGKKLLTLGVLLPSLAQWVLKLLMWLFFLSWLLVIVLYPAEPVAAAVRRWFTISGGTIFGVTGSIFLAFSAPVLIVALLAFVYISAFPSDDHFHKKELKSLSFRLWTFPVLVDWPFGVVTAVELIGILLFSTYVLWAVASYTMQNLSLIGRFQLPPSLKCYLMLELTGLRLGSVGLFAMAFLFLPVARGSILLRLVDIPFEHATRYHVWLGHLTMALFTMHGLCYVAAWLLQGRLWEQMVEWRDIGVAKLPGVISLAAGLLMWATSLRPVRKNQFELFFYTHQLYIVFAVFLALHIGDTIFCMAAGPVFIFILDRFLRFWQSRAKVDIVSASCRPCGTVELVFSKPAGLRYNALSFLFIQVRELSLLQWHPFSVSSSPLDGSRHVSVLIKVLGSWTRQLREIITKFQEQSSRQARITACVEGPYGHESANHLRYQNLILVAGGIGVSPFLAVLSDIIHRSAERKPCLPRNVLMIWSVKKSVELSLLSAVDAQLIFSDNLNIDIQSYVTQEEEPALEEGKVDREAAKIPSLYICNGESMSSLVGTGSNLWAGMYFLTSILGAVAFLGLVEVHCIGRFNIISSWLGGLIFTGCMLAGVFLPGGFVILLWHLFAKTSTSRAAKQDSESESDDEKRRLNNAGTPRKGLSDVQLIRFGRRPDLAGIFTSFTEKLESNADIGVFVCGPQGLQASVARACRSLNLKGSGTGDRPVFHFNSHSFEL